MGEVFKEAYNLIFITKLMGSLYVHCKKFRSYIPVRSDLLSVVLTTRRYTNHKNI